MTYEVFCPSYISYELFNPSYDYNIDYSEIFSLFSYNEAALISVGLSPNKTFFYFYIFF